MIRPSNIAQRMARSGAAWLCLMVLLVLSGSAVAQVNPFGRQLRGSRHIVQGGMLTKPDSAALRRADSVRVASLVASLSKLSPDSLAAIKDSVMTMLPDTLHRKLFAPVTPDSLAIDSLAKDTTKLSEKQLQRQQKRENRKPLLSDSMAMNRVCWASLVLPGFGQIYNKQYWKLPILYGTVGASLGLCLWANSEYKPLKRQFDAITDQSLLRTPQLNSLQREMIKYNTMKQVFMFSTIASYLYFIGDTAMNYSTTEVSHIKRATTLAMICPGAGQIYNKSYWRAPIVLGGLAATIYCIDWNNRGYQRFKKAYRLKADYDANPDLYPDGSLDEFSGRYSASFLKNLRNSYRRNRDLCIILTAGIYVLQIIDAHVDAHLREYDISRDLNLKVEPMVNYAFNPSTGGGAAVGMNFNFTF